MRNLQHREVFGSKLEALKDKKWKSMWKDKLILQLRPFKTSVSFTDRFGTSIPPYACDFSTVIGETDYCIAVDEEGFVSVIDTNLQNSPLSKNIGDPSLREKWVTHNNAVFDVKFVPKSQHFVTASGDTTAALWDITKPGTKIASFHGHSCSLKSVSVSTNNTNIFATGSRDGNIILWDRRCSNWQKAQQHIGRIKDAHAVYDSLTPQRKRKRYLYDNGSPLFSDSRQTVTSVVFQTSHTLVSSGAMDGTVKLWDIRKVSGVSGTKSTSHSTSPVKEFLYPGESDRRRGYNCLCLDSTGTRLFASCTDNVIYEYDLSSATHRTSKPTKRYTGHYSSSFYVRIAISPDDMHLLSGCDDDMAYIWNINEDCQKFLQPSHCIQSEGMQQVTSVAWCPTDSAKFVTCSDDAALRIWGVPIKTASNETPTGSITNVIKQSGSSYQTDTKENKPIGFFQQASIRNLSVLNNGCSEQNFDEGNSRSPKQTKLRQQLISTSFELKPSPKRQSYRHQNASASGTDDKENVFIVDTASGNSETNKEVCRQTGQALQCQLKINGQCNKKRIKKRYSIRSYFNTVPEQN